MIFAARLPVLQFFLLLYASSSSAVEAKRSSSSKFGDELSLLSSSSFFKSNYNYYTKPPHDTKLYDTLGIAPNATMLQVQKGHRRRSLLYHPDKIPPSQVIEAKHKLDKISHAYAILNNDQSRLLYHRYGIVDENEEYILRLLILGNNAAGNYDQGGGGGGDATLLSSSHSSSVVGVENDEIVERRQQQFRLLELMGFPLQNNHRGGSYDQQQQQQYSHQQRKEYLVGTITEQLRPMVEGTISQDMFINDIYQECNILKYCPFGAHILRCIGRAYRIEGYRALRRSMSSSSLSSSRHSLIGDESTPTIMTDGVVDAYRDVKKYASAAFAGVRLLLTERGMRKLEDEEVRVRSRKRRQEQFRRRDDDNSGDSASDNANSNSDDDYDNDNSYLSSHDDNNHNNEEQEDDDESSFEEVIQRIRRQRTHKALLSAHQMEALWKITKIELDRTVRDACRFVLCHYGDDYYLNHRHSRTQHHHLWSLSSSSSHPTHPSPSSPIPISPPFDGWVSTKGEVVQLHVGKLRAAAAMILIGDIFVQSSKEGTSWK